MKKLIIFVSFAILALFASCAEDSLIVNNPRHIVVTAEIPDDNLTRTSLTQKDGSLDMIAQLDKDDEVFLLVEQDGKFYQNKSSELFGAFPLTSVSENKKSCTFEFDLREEIDPNRPYTIYGGIGLQIFATDLDGKECGLGYTYIHRMVGLNHIPLYFALESGKGTEKAKFKHLTAYEILHVTNTGKASINFNFGGFESDEPWYYTNYYILFPDYKIWGDSNTKDGYNYDVTISPGETKDFLSFYVPTGKKMSNARMRAIVNGNEITSSNTKSSDANIEIGNAYHLYATWDGNELKFGKEDRPYETDDYILSGDRKTLIKWKGSEEFVNMNSTPDLASIEIIGKEAFRELSTLKSIILPQGVKIIERDAFYLCKNVESISLPSSLLSIGIEAFGDCWKLKDITIPSSVEDIGKFAFYGCEELTSLAIPNKVKVIGEWTFYSCI